MNIVDKYLKILDKIFYNISLHENKKIDLENKENLYYLTKNFRK